MPCDLRVRLHQLYGVPDVPAPHVLQPRAHQHIWVTIGVGGTNRWNHGYVYCVLGAPSFGPNDLASWSLFEGAETWRTLFTLFNECELDRQTSCNNAKDAT